MFDFISLATGRLSELFHGSGHRGGIFVSFAPRREFALLAGIVAAAILLAMLFTRRGRSIVQMRRGGRLRFGLRWKIIKTFAGTTLLVGLLMIGFLYSVLGDAIQHEVNQRALTIATNLSDTAGTRLSAKDARGLRRVLAQYAELKEVAYTLVEDRHGKVIGGSFRVFPKDLAPLLGDTDLRVVRHASATLGGEKLYDTRVPLLNGEIGAVHVGIWQFAVDDEVNQALLPIIGLLLVILVVAVILAIAIARRISRPILHLAQSADQISKGELDLPVRIASNDELGELGHSIERLRASLKAAMVRLDHQES